jgi:hypothetical protein
MFRLTLKDDVRVWQAEQKESSMSAAYEKRSDYGKYMSWMAAYDTVLKKMAVILFYHAPSIT